MKAKLHNRGDAVAPAGVAVAIETPIDAAVAIPIANHVHPNAKPPAVRMNSTTIWRQPSRSTTIFSMKTVKTIPIARIVATFHLGMKRSKTSSRRIWQVARRADVRGDGGVARATAMIANS